MENFENALVEENTLNKYSLKKTFNKYNKGHVDTRYKSDFV